MESLSLIAGEIASDFNNLLTIISGYSHMLAAGLDEGDRNCFALRQIIKASNSAAALTRQLLSFSRRRRASCRLLNLNSVLQNLGPMLDRLVGEQISLSIASGNALDLVHGDPGQIEQIIMNLFINAREAMPRGGTLKIETSNVELGLPQEEGQLNRDPGAYVMLAFTDTGIGMDRATRERVFEAFFTTKENGLGTGLGLSIVHGITQRLKGSIEVHSQPGQGTVVKVFLPRAKSGEAHQQAKRSGVLAEENSEALAKCAPSTLAR